MSEFVQQYIVESVRVLQAIDPGAVEAVANGLARVRDGGGRLLRDVRVFDVYAREGQTSLAVRLEFRATDRTLTDDEIAPLREKIVGAVRDKLEGELRSG